MRMLFLEIRFYFTFRKCSNFADRASDDVSSIGTSLILFSDSSLGFKTIDRLYCSILSNTKCTEFGGYELDRK